MSLQKVQFAFHRRVLLHAEYISDAAGASSIIPTGTLSQKTRRLEKKRSPKYSCIL